MVKVRNCKSLLEGTPEKKDISQKLAGSFAKVRDCNSISYHQVSVLNFRLISTYFCTINRRKTNFSFLLADEKVCMHFHGFTDLRIDVRKVGAFLCLKIFAVV